MDQRRLNVLMLCDFNGRNANVIRDYLYSFNAYSRHRFYYFHDSVHLTGRFDFSRFDVVAFFWDCLWFWRQRIDPRALANIARCRALKVLFQQDEYRYVRPNNALVGRLGIQVVMTLVEPQYHELIYPRSRLPSLQAAYTVLPGYVPDYMTGLPLTPLAGRPVDIGYRSRVMPFHLGDLAREKLTIAQRWERLAREHHFVADISVREEDRLYGKDWLAFLQSCKFALGTESGASVIDLTGDIARRCTAYLRRHPHAPYEEVRAKFFADVDGKPDMKTVAPRVFESVAYGNVLLQHEGDYGGILRPDEHYIAIRKDYSNLAGVVARMRDPAFCERLRANAHRDLIASGRYSYRAFVQRCDDILDAHAPAAVARAPSRVGFYATNYVLRGQQLVPRGSGFVRVPRPVLADAVGWARTLRHLPWQGLLVLALLWDVPVLRRALAGGLLRPWRWPRASLAALWPDLIRLGTLRYARGGGGPCPVRYHLEPRWDETESACRLVSVRLPRRRPRRAAGLPAELRQALAARRCPRLVWDHRAVTTWAVFGVGRHWARVMYLAPGATWDFFQLVRFCRDHAVDARTLVEQLVDERPSALRSWRRLRVPLLLYVATGLGVRVAVWQTLLLPWRILAGVWRNYRGLQALLVLGLVVDVPALRRPLAAFLLRPWQWRTVGLRVLWEDLVRLALVRATEGRGPLFAEPFRIRAAWHAERRTLELHSEPTPADVPRPALAGLTPPPEAGGRPWNLAWDHAAVGECPAIGFRDEGNLCVVMGWEYVWRFRGLYRFQRHAALDPGVLLASLLADGPCAVRSRWWLRLLVRALVFWHALLFIPQCLYRDPLAFPGRVLRKALRILGRPFGYRPPPEPPPLDQDEPERAPPSERRTRRRAA